MGTDDGCVPNSGPLAPSSGGALNFGPLAPSSGGAPNFGKLAPSSGGVGGGEQDDPKMIPG